MLAPLAIALALVLPVDGKELFMRQQAFIQSDSSEGGEPGKAAQVAEYPDGATLPTDTEVDRIVKRAEEYVRDGRYDLAAVVWQKVLDGSTSVLRTDNGRYYTSVQGYIEQQLDRVAREAPLGLKEYRIKADGEARELIAQAKGKDEEKALADVVRRFFYSSLGDDAAYALGNLMLDRYEFVAATRLFTNILQRHPDYTTRSDTPPSIPVREVLMRLAVSAARSGDVKTAKAAADELTKDGATAKDPELLAWIAQAIKKGGDVDVVGTSAGEWLTTLGSFARDGRMAGLPADTQYTGVWQEKWIARFNDQSFGVGMAQGNTPPQPMLRRGIGGGNQPQAAVSNTSDGRRRNLARKWETSDWNPTDSLLLHGGRVYFRAYDRVVAVDGRTGKSVFSSPSKVMPQVRPFQTSSAEEVLLFGDRASNTMSIHDGILYYLEEDSNSYMQQNQTYFRSRSGVAGFRPQFGNRIVALDARSGKLQWRTENEADDAGNKRSVRYQCAPVAYGNLLLAPAIDNGALWLYARRADKRGEIVWRTFLADDPPGGYAPWTTTGLSIAGGDAYLVSSGVVFNVEATGGVVRWASRYTRDMDGSARQRNYGNQSSPSPRGWDDDLIIPIGRTLVVAANDRDALMAFDRQTGKFLWEVERDGATHVLGTSGRFLFIAGRDVIRKYDLNGGGRLMRVAELEKPISGRGFVAEDAIYLPQGNAIARYHPDSLKRLSIVGIALPINDSEGNYDYSDPVGNLYSDGQRLYGVGIERVYALGTIEKVKPAPPIEDPTKVGADGSAPKPSAAGSGDPNVDVLAEHGIEATAESLRGFLRSMHPTAEVKKQIDETVRQLGDDDYQKRKDAQKSLLAMAIVPVEALLAAKESSADEEVRDAAARILAATEGKRSRVLFAALMTIRKKEIKGLAEPVLAAVAFCNQQYLLESIGQALKSTAAEVDAPLLRKAVADASPEVRIVAATALGTVLKEKAKADLENLNKDADPRVRLAAARAMADYGDRASMEMLVSLLEAEDVIIRGGAIRSLRSLTGQKIDFVPYDDVEKRKPAVEAWKAWIAIDGKTAKLNFPLADTKFLLGRMLFANYRTGKITEINEKGEETWTTTASNPWGVLGLPNGHRLVSSYTTRNVVEYNGKGEKVWEQTNLPTAPFSVERLENGNTLIACSNSNQVLEVDAANKIVWQATIIGRPTDARRLPSGRTLVALQSSNRVVELNREGKEEWKLEGCISPICAQRLPNGNTLVAEVGGNRVREVDPEGKEVWTLTNIGARRVQNPYSAERLDNGNTLVADNSGIYELDPKGTVVWQRLEQGVSRVSKY